MAYEEETTCYERSVCRENRIIVYESKEYPESERFGYSFFFDVKKPIVEYKTSRDEVKKGRWEQIQNELWCIHAKVPFNVKVICYTVRDIMSVCRQSKQDV